MNSIQNQLQFYRLCFIIARNSGQLENNPEQISSSIAKLYGELTGVSKGTGTILNIAKIACGLEEYVKMEGDTKEKIQCLFESFDSAERVSQPMYVKKTAKSYFEKVYPEYKNKKFSYFQHVWNIWIEQNQTRRDKFTGGVLEDIDRKLQLDVDITESRKLRDLQLDFHE